MKMCRKCKVEKRNVEFNQNIRNKDNLTSYCKECNNKQSTEWVNQNEYKAKNNALKKKYGVGQVWYDAQIIKQNFSCCCCGTHQSELTKALAVDHCHTSGAVRGLLCHGCNVALGFAKDSPELLRRLALYLEEGPSYDY